MLDCMDLNKELHRIMILFTTYLQSQSVGMQQLVLRGILKLSQRQDTVSRGGQECHRCHRSGWACHGAVAEPSAAQHLSMQ